MTIFFLRTVIVDKVIKAIDGKYYADCDRDKASDFVGPNQEANAED